MLEPSDDHRIDAPDSVPLAESRNETLLPEPQPRFLGKYEIRRSLGRGGMGEVFLGYDAILARQVAIKVLPREVARHADFVARFYAEAAAAASVTHLHVIPIHYIGEDAGRHFFVMSYVEGESLSQRLARDVRLNVDESLSIIDDVLAGLQAAHAKGLIHRDVKPANILLDKLNGSAVVADFGLVKTLGEVGGRTATGVILGTVEYMAPEQGRGRDIDHRCDLYSTGVMLYRMLSGRLPFHAESPTGMIFQHVYERPQPLVEILPELPSALWAVTAKLLAKSPHLRYPHAQAVREDLMAVRQQRALPSGAELADFGSYWKHPSGRRHNQPASIIVTVPSFDANPAESVASMHAAKWWRQVPQICADWWSALRPNWLPVLESTQQQIDGAIDEYQRRQQELRSLVREADSVLATLNNSRHHIAASETNFSDLIAGQAEQLSSMRLKLAQADATLQRLRSQRDLFNARLKAARARAQIESGRTASPFWKRHAAIGLGVALTTCGIVAMIWNTIGSSQSDIPTIATVPMEASETTATPSAGLLSTDVLSSPIMRTPLLANDVGFVSFSDDGSFLHAVSHSGLIEFHDTVDGQLLRSIELPAIKGASVFGDAHSLYFARMIPTSINQPTRKVELHDLRDAQTVVARHELSADEAVLSLLEAPPRVWAVSTTSSDTTIRILETGTARDSLRWPAMSATVRALDSNGRQLALSSAGAIQIFDVSSEANPAVPRIRLATSAVQLAFHPHESWLAAVPAEGDRLVLWDLNSQQPFAELIHNREQITRFAFDAQGRRLAVASAQQIRIWDLELQYLRMVIPAADTRTFSFNRDGTVLAVVDGTGQISIWNTTFPALKTEFEAWWKSLSVERTAELESVRPAVETYHSKRATSADGRLALVAADRNSLNLEDAVTDEHFNQYPVESIDAVAIAPDGRWAATAAVVRSEKRPGVQFWNLRSGRQIGPTTPQTDSVWSLNFSTDSRWLVAGGNGRLIVWEVATQSVHREIATEAAQHQWVLFSPDNRRLISADPRQICNRMYSIRSGQLLWEIWTGPARWAFVSPEIIGDQRFGTWRSLKSHTVPTWSQR